VSEIPPHLDVHVIVNVGGRESRVAHTFATPRWIIDERREDAFRAWVERRSKSVVELADVAVREIMIEIAHRQIT